VLVTIVLCVSLFVNAYLSWTIFGVDGISDQFSSLNTEYVSYKHFHNYTNVEYEALLTEKNSLDVEYEALLTIKNALEAAKLVTKLSTFDNRQQVQPFLNVYGIVYNVGTNDAHNCLIAVLATRQGEIVLNALINLGTIEGEDLIEVDYQINYNGSMLDYPVDLKIYWE